MRGVHAFGWMMLALAVPAMAAGSRATTVPASTRPATTAPRSIPRNLDTTLESSITLEADALGLEKVVDRLRELTQTNIVVNWNALAKANVTRETPVTFFVRGVTYEYTVRALMEAIPATGTKANYTVGENTLEITTNADLGVSNMSRLYDLTRAASYSLSPAPRPEEITRNAALLDRIFRAELIRAGEPLEVKGHDILVKDQTLSLTVSERGQGLIGRAVNMFNQPLKVGQLAGGTQLTAWAKRTNDAYKAYLATPGAASPEAMARDPRKFNQFSIALLPGTKDALAGEAPRMAAAINDGGVLLIGPQDVMRSRTLLAVYDLREVIKKLTARNKIKPEPPAADFQTAVVHILRSQIKPEGEEWGTVDDMGKKHAILIPYNGLLVAFATAETHRTLAGALQDLNK